MTDANKLVKELVFHLYDAGDATFVAERDGSNARELFKLELLAARFAVEESATTVLGEQPLDAHV